MREIDVSIEPFNESHQHSIDVLSREIQREFFIPFSSKDSRSITELSKDPNQKYWVALSHGKVIGTIGVVKISENRGVLKRMFLKKGFRGKENGIAHKLLQLAIYYSIENDLTEIYLGTMTQFVAAQKFYISQGFVQITEKQLPKDFPANPMDTLFYMMAIA
jgi:N-acetylglutamate synthase-like GNAT family acetyltransferase